MKEGRWEKCGREEEDGCLGMNISAQLNDSYWIYRNIIQVHREAAPTTNQQEKVVTGGQSYRKKKVSNGESAP